MIYVEKLETMPREQMRELQLRRLRKMIDYCYENVDFYHNRLKKAGITSGRQIRDLKDIEKIPFTTKADLSENYPKGFLAVPMNKVARIHASSGTTGNPSIGYYTKADMETWRELAARVLVENGLTSDDVFQLCVGYGLFTGALGFHQGAEQLGCTVIPASTGNTRRQLIMMRDTGVTAITATPSYATYLSEIISNSDIPRSEYKLKRVLLGAERCTRSMRKTIEKNLGVVTADNYGLTECFGPGVAGECEMQQGLHISEDVFYPEIVDPETDKVLPDGEEGELVFTSLKREAMPLLRYRTRDITRLNHEKCGCGRTSVRMEAPSARRDDMFVFKGVNIFPSQIELALGMVEELSPHYHVLLTRSQCCDKAELFVETSEPIDSYSEAQKLALEKKISKALHEIMVVRFDIRLTEPGSLKRFEGKGKRVEDRRYENEG